MEVTGQFPSPVTINGKPVWDLTDPGAPKPAIFKPGVTYSVEERGEWWIVLRATENP
jgi:hypothetical protein